MEKFIFVTGGLLEVEQAEEGGQLSQRSRTMGTTERYDSAKKVWEILPELNVPRQGHSSCAMDDTVYVFCGCDGQGYM